MLCQLRLKDSIVLTFKSNLLPSFMIFSSCVFHRTRCPVKLIPVKIFSYIVLSEVPALIKLWQIQVCHCDCLLSGYQYDALVPIIFIQIEIIDWYSGCQTLQTGLSFSGDISFNRGQIPSECQRIEYLFFLFSFFVLLPFSPVKEHKSPQWENTKVDASVTCSSLSRAAADDDDALSFHRLETRLPDA